MVNRLSRSPGDFQRSTVQGRVGGVPDFAVGPGTQAAQALEDLGAGLSRKIGAMADDAAAREGELAGMSAGAAAGEKFIEKSAIEARGAAKPAGATTPAATPAVPPPGSPALDSQPFQLRRDGTIRGEAFDAAAIKSYGWRLQQGVATDLAQAYQDNQDSPSGYEKAVSTISGRYLQDPLLKDPQVREVFDQTFADKVAIGRLTIASRHEANLQAAAKASAVDGLEAMRNSLERDAYAVGGNPAGDKPLTAQLSRIEGQIDSLVKDGTLSPAEAETQKRAFRNTVFGARMDGTFDAMPNPEQQQDFALGFMDRWAKGEFPELSLSDAQAMSNELYAKAVRNRTAVTSARKAEEGQLATSIEDDVASIAATGQGLDPKTSGLTAARVETLLGTSAVEDWRKAQAKAQKAWEATAGMEVETAAEISDRLAVLKPDGSATMAESNPAGLVAPGNIDLNARAVVRNSDGSISTEESISFEEDGVEVLVPTVFGGAHHSTEEAIDHYHQTGEFLGKFDTASAADAYAALLHQRQDQRYSGGLGFADRQAIYEAAQKQADAIIKERETDPLGQAARGKLVTLTPIDTSSPDALQKALAARRQEAEIVARQYGTAPTIFRPSEVKSLAQAFEADPDLLPGFATAAVASLGELAPAALSQLGTQGPEVAHAAGIELATKDSSVAQDVAAALKARADKSFKSKMPADAQMTDAAGAILGPALAATPQGLYAVMGTANLLFEYDANRLGFDPSEIAKPGSAANAAYQKSIERALGARYINGTKYGGLAEINDRQVVVPSSMPADQFPGILEDVADEDLKRLPAIASGNGVSVGAADLRRGHLVTVGDGLYRVALGDPDGFDPQYLVTPAGDYWVLDAAQLDQIETARENLKGSGW